VGLSAFHAPANFPNGRQVDRNKRENGISAVDQWVTTYTTECVESSLCQMGAKSLKDKHAVVIRRPELEHAAAPGRSRDTQLAAIFRSEHDRMDRGFLALGVPPFSAVKKILVRSTNEVSNDCC